MSNSILLEEEKKKQEEANKTKDVNSCECPKTEKQKKVEERERNLDIRFQDYLQNAVYVKRYICKQNTKMIVYSNFYRDDYISVTNSVCLLIKGQPSRVASTCL